jgi:tryptophan 2,3-dioxygenase
MNISENAEAILNEIEKNIHRSKTETHLEGLLWSKPMTYWDYIQTDA